MNYITESSPLSFFSDLISKIKGAKEKASAARRESDAKKNYIRGSISEYTKDLIMTFPTMVDNSLPPETASMISKATERNVVSMLRMLFASMQIKGSDGAEILGRIHKNINSALSLDDYIDIFDDMSALKGLKESGKISYNEKIYEKIIQEAWRNHKEKRFPLTSFNERSLNGYMVKRNNLMKKVAVREVSEEYITEAKKRLKKYEPSFYQDDQGNIFPVDDRTPEDKDYDAMMRSGDIADANLTIKKDLASNVVYKTKIGGKEVDITSPEIDAIKSIRDLELAEDRAKDDHRRLIMQLQDQKQRLRDARKRNEIDQRDYDQRLKEFNQKEKDADRNFDLKEKEYNLKRQQILSDMRRKDVEDKYRTQQYKDQHRTSTIDSLSKQLLDQDVKKVNELTPTLLTVTYNTFDTDGKLYDEKTFIAGVKSRLISVDPADIIERLIAKNKTKVSFLNFIRATTGEISFVKDFLFCTKQAKIDAKNSVKKGPAAKLWKVLENRSVKNNWHKLNRNGNDASSITTLVINQETVNMMKKEYDFNLEILRNARMIMDAYNLLAIVICDESIEVAKFLYAGNDSFEQQAYSSLEKESKDNSYKKVINLIGQMNR